MAGKIAVTISALLSLGVLCAPVRGAITEDDKGILAYQLDVSRQIAEHLDELFSNFSVGDIEADKALESLSLWENEYLKAVRPVPEELSRLDVLVKQLFSQIENYFIYYKRANRENPEINLSILKTRRELFTEVVRLQNI